jgi:ribonuclease HI
LELVSKPRSDLTDVPLQNAHLELFVDGSAQHSEKGEALVAYAVTTTSTTLESAKLPSHLSAAELFALTRACILARGQSATIYTDSRYAFGVVHDFGTLWKQRGFLTSSGKTISHSKLVDNLLKAILLPSEISVCKCLAHANSSDPVSKGNAVADLAA